MHPRVGATRRGVFHVEPARQHRPARAGTTVLIGPLRQRSPSTDPCAPPAWVRCARASSHRSIPVSRCSAIAFPEAGADPGRTRRPPRNAARGRPGGCRAVPAEGRPQWARPTPGPARRDAHHGRRVPDGWPGNPDAPGVDAGDDQSSHEPRRRGASGAPRSLEWDSTLAGRRGFDTSPSSGRQGPPASERSPCRDGSASSIGSGCPSVGEGSGTPVRRARLSRRVPRPGPGRAASAPCRWASARPVAMSPPARSGESRTSPIVPGPLVHVKQDPCRPGVPRQVDGTAPGSAPNPRVTRPGPDADPEHRTFQNPRRGSPRARPSSRVADMPRRGSAARPLQHRFRSGPPTTTKPTRCRRPSGRQQP